ncbi:hypothetical protein BZA05DRAFT_447121 [Tricharina praecox]|uniref:uncharacterized protein n=1 Tax=Tricharina praecox TaxID=43433 RepID=UPI002220B433|nr:uncharacterized protein BZA05DRAFT_447121 [Tricharina praecox]KAI5846837.1 hypothetical protein BZA05DRAFT_447121 [Tricharina praecox]
MACDRTFPRSAVQDHDHDIAAGPTADPPCIGRFLTTTQVSIVNAVEDGDGYRIPLEHFVNPALLGRAEFQLLPDLAEINFRCSREHYAQAAQYLDIVLLQDYDPTMWRISKHRTFGTVVGAPGARQVGFAAMLAGEGVPFAVVGASLAPGDVQGMYGNPCVWAPDALPLRARVMIAILMFDFCNPVYSWRRGVLLDYLPETTASCDCMSTCCVPERAFLTNVQNSPHAADPSSPEWQLLHLLHLLSLPSPGATLTVMRAQITAYLTTVQAKLQTYTGVLEYTKLAECRRRIHRPLPVSRGGWALECALRHDTGPIELAAFGSALPYALRYLDTGPIEMSPDGSTRPVPARGVDWLNRSLGTTRWSRNCDCVPSHIPAAAPDCPVPHLRPHGFTPHPPRLIATNPTWATDIAALFANPYWVPEERRYQVGAGFVERHLDLSCYERAKTTAKEVYEYMERRCRKAEGRQHWFPEDAVETFKMWMEQGCRVDMSEKGRWPYGEMRSSREKYVSWVEKYGAMSR